jgi:hypothetical protein
MSYQIRYIIQTDIDKTKWDRCIDQAPNGLIYGYSIYLDTMSAHWDALVLNDYQAVMPLTWNRKYGFYYLYQPFLSASLGLFGNDIKADLLAAFLHAIPRKFRLWEFSLNHGNVFFVPGFHLFERMNFVLSLNDEYDKLYERFRENVKRNIRKADKLRCQVKIDFDVDEVITLAELQMHSFAKVKENDLSNFRRLYKHLHNKGKAITYGIEDEQKKLISSAVFFYSHNRAYYILVGNHPNGKTLGAGHALINAFIKDHAGRNLFLDFEGSDIGNIAFFYSSFGAREEKYSAIVNNRLPGIINIIRTWIKR